MATDPSAVPFDPDEWPRPHPSLLAYYFLLSLLSGPLVVVVFPVYYFRYHTLRYRFDDRGVSMKVGILFRKEVQLTYRRIQDIHLTRNLLQRWMGLASVAVQTASGNSGAEMTVEGVLPADSLRDYLYARMRGAGERAEAEGAADDEALSLLVQIRDSLRAVAERGAAS